MMPVYPKKEKQRVYKRTCYRCGRVIRTTAKTRKVVCLKCFSGKGGCAALE